MTIDEKLDQLLEILARIEERQKRTTKMVEQVKESEAAPIGSFGTVDSGT